MRHYRWLIMGVAILVLPILLVGCVTKSEYETLQEKYIDLQVSYDILLEENANLEEESAEMLIETENLQEQLEDLEDTLDLYEYTYGTVTSISQEPQQSYFINETLSLGLVKVDEKVAVAGDGEAIVLINNGNAEDPTYKELKEFLDNDWTDLCFYNDLPNFYPGGIGFFFESDPWDTIDLDYYTSWAELGKTEVSAFSREGRFYLMICSDFAEILHNNAELQGIHAAFVIITLEDNTFHALNAFKTLDRGLIFIDSTGEGIQSAQNNLSEDLLFEKWLNSWDKIANVNIGEYMTFSAINGNRKWEPMGTVYDIEVYW